MSVWCKKDNKIETMSEASSVSLNKTKKIGTEKRLGIANRNVYKDKEAVVESCLLN